MSVMSNFLRRRGGFVVVSTLVLAAAAGGASAAPSPADLKLERVVMLFRHGVRAPLPGEAAPGFARDPWPIWSTPGSFLTPHGREAVRLTGVYDRQLFDSLGLTPRHGCPSVGAVTIWTNAVERTIATGEALAEGLAPGCGVKVGHLPIGRADPLFRWPGPDLSHFKASQAVAAINLETGGASKLAAPYGHAFSTLQRIIGCDDADKACDIAALPGGLSVSPDGRGVDLGGPIHIASGAAQVLMLEYLEGLPMAQVGWGRASLPQLTEISRLHALLFDLYSRPNYIAPRVAGVLGRRLLQSITGRAGGSKLAIFVGHDDNIAAITALLGADFQSRGYGLNDPPIGAALMFEVFRSRTTGLEYVRTQLQAQSPDQLRRLESLSLRHPPAIQPLTHKICALTQTSLCRLSDFSRGLRKRLTLQ